MNQERIVSEVSIQSDSKIILLVMDGLGGLPVQGKTELEAANTPHLDHLAAKSACGLTDPVFMGITPGSGPAHLALFGYDPTQYILGRGILEALGSDVEVGKNDLVARGNFATLKDDLIVDRRAGRIPTEENAALCQRLNNALKARIGLKITLYPAKEHRFVVKFSGEELSDALTDADPQKENTPRVYTSPLCPEAAKTAQIVNDFLDEVTDILKDLPRANTVLLRGFSKYPTIPTLVELFKLRPAAIANYPMYKGLARLVGMEILKAGQNLSDLFDAAEKHYKDHDFFYIHVKKTDSAGEDGNFKAKKEAIEETDSYIPRLLALKPDVLVVTSDHSTPSLLKSHSWHPNPFLLFSENAIADKVMTFTEKECSQGYLGRFQAIYAMPLMLAHARKLKKFGA
ncbi:MAG: 2,3-bisphosphoglycerate-independent phosphoglycerate mutase [Candidatus Aminicenantes bacterium]|nr:2,3-bisphosphoglycerate-independent phosphoglycerate mutase [Candidatus Aminicenantes bacterium]